MIISDNNAFELFVLGFLDDSNMDVAKDKWGKPILYVLKYLANIIQTPGDLLKRQICMYKKIFLENFVSREIVKLLLDIGFIPVNKVVESKDEDAFASAKDQLSLINGYINSDGFFNYLQIDLPENAYGIEFQRALTQLKNSFFVLEYVASILEIGSFPKIDPDSNWISRREKLESLRRFPKFFCPLNCFQIKSIPIPGVDSLYVSCNHTRRKVMQTGPHWEIPKKLRDSIFLFTIEQDRVQKGILINILEAESLRRAIWNLRMKCSAFEPFPDNIRNKVKFSLWLLPDAAINPTFASLLASVAIPSSGNGTSQSHAFDDPLPMVSTYSSFCRLFSGRVRFTATESRALLTDVCFGPMTCIRKRKLAAALLETRPHDDCTLGLLFTFTSCDDWLATVCAIKLLREAIIGAFSTLEDFFIQNTPGKILLISEVINLLENERLQKYFNDNDGCLKDCISRFIDVIGKLGKPSVLKLNEFANILSLGAEESDISNDLFTGINELSVIRLTSLYTTEEQELQPQRFAVSYIHRQASEIADSSNHDLLASSITASGLPLAGGNALMRQNSMDSFKEKATRIAKNTALNARRRKDIVARKSLAKLFLSDTQPFIPIGSFCATGFGGSVAYMIDGSSLKAVETECHIYPTMTLSDSGLADLGFFGSRLYPEDHVICKYNEIAHGSVTYYPRGVPCSHGRSFFRVRICQNIALAKSQSTDVSAQCLIPLVGVGIIPTSKIGTFPGLSASHMPLQAHVQTDVTIVEVKADEIPSMDHSDGIFMTIVQLNGILRYAVFSSKNVFLLRDIFDVDVSETIGCFVNLPVAQSESYIEFLLGLNSTNGVQNIRIPFQQNETRTTFSPVIWMQKSHISTLTLSAKLEIRCPGVSRLSGSYIEDEFQLPSDCCWVQTPSIEENNKLISSSFKENRGKWYIVKSHAESSIMIEEDINSKVTVIRGRSLGRSMCFKAGIIVASGKWYYECTVDVNVCQSVNIGWQDSSSQFFETSKLYKGMFWTLNPNTCQTTHSVIKNSGGSRQRGLITIGTCLDCDSGEISFVVGTSLQDPTFYKVRSMHGFTPVIFVSNIYDENKTAIEINMGFDLNKSFKCHSNIFARGFKALCNWDRSNSVPSSLPEFSRKSAKWIIEEFNGPQNIMVSRPAITNSLLQHILSPASLNILTSLPGVLVSAISGRSNVLFRSRERGFSDHIAMRFINSYAHSAFGFISPEVSVRSDMGIDIISSDSGGACFILVNVPDFTNFVVNSSRPHTLPLQNVAVDLAHIDDQFYIGQKVYIRHVSLEEARRSFSSSSTVHWAEGMAEYLGKIGTVSSVGENLGIQFNTKENLSFSWHKDLIEGEIFEGSSVTIKTVSTRYAKERMDQTRAGFSPTMGMFLGKTGVCESDASWDGLVNVRFPAIAGMSTGFAFWVRDMVEPLDSSNISPDAIPLTTSDVSPGLYLVSRGMEIGDFFSDGRPMIATLSQSAQCVAYHRICSPLSFTDDVTFYFPGGSDLPTWSCLSCTNVNDISLRVCSTCNASCSASIFCVKISKSSTPDSTTATDSTRECENSKYPKGTKVWFRRKDTDIDIAATVSMISVTDPNKYKVSVDGTDKMEKAVDTELRFRLDAAFTEQFELRLDMSNAQVNYSLKDWKLAAAVSTVNIEVPGQNGDILNKQGVGSVYLLDEALEVEEVSDNITKDDVLYCGRGHEMSLTSSGEWVCSLCFHSFPATSSRYCCPDCEEECCLDCAPHWQVRFIEPDIEE